MKRDPMEMYNGAKQHTVVEGAGKKRRHDESDLHLEFCKWVRKNYPNDQFIRHEREKARTPFMQNLMKLYNSDNDKMPDFELLEPVWVGASVCMDCYHRLYIEFKKPGTVLTLKDGVTIKPEYAEQYRRHVTFFRQNSPAYFCSDLEVAKHIFISYKQGYPIPMQEFKCPVKKEDQIADDFFNKYYEHG